MIRPLTFGLVLTLVATAAWGQATPIGDERAQHWFRVSWAPPAAIGDIPSAGETSFAVEPLSGAVDYRITVVSWDLVSLDRAPQAP
jgi:hypothetical protein